MNIPNTLRDIARELEKLNLPVTVRSAHTSQYWNKANILALKKKLKR